MYDPNAPLDSKTVDANRDAHLEALRTERGFYEGSDKDRVAEIDKAIAAIEKADSVGIAKPTDVPNRPEPAAQAAAIPGAETEADVIARSEIDPAVAGETEERSAPHKRAQRRPRNAGQDTETR